MKDAYVVTEGQRDVDILTALLPEHLTNNVLLVNGGGNSSAETLSRSILVVRQIPVALVLDTDTVDTYAAQEKRESARAFLWDVAAPGLYFDVFIAVPEIEAILFQDRALLEHLTQHTFTDAEWEEARRHPKKVLDAALGLDGDNGKRRRKDDDRSLAPMLATLTPEAKALLQPHPLIRELSEFLTMVMQKN